MRMNINSSSPISTTWKIGLAPSYFVQTKCLVPTAKCDLGPELEFLIILMKLLNVTAEYHVVTDISSSGCGTLLPNGTWTGVMGMLQAKTIDFIGNLCMFSQDRTNANFTAYSFPVRSDKQNFLVKIPKLEYQFRFYATFQPIVWYLILATCLLYVSVEFVFFVAFFKLRFKDALVKAMGEMFNIVFSLGSGRIMFFLFTHLTLFMMVYLAFIFSLYSASITNALISPVVIEQPFVGMTELLSKMDTVDYKVLDFARRWSLTNCITAECQVINDNINQYRYVRYPQRPDTKTQMIDFIGQLKQHENLVIVTGKIWVDVYLQSFLDASEFWQFDDEDHLMLWYGYFVSSDFKHKELVNNALIGFGGCMSNLLDRHTRPSMTVNRGKTVKGKVMEKFFVTFSIIQWPVLMYFAGIFLSVILLLVELFSNRIRTKSFNLVEL